MKKTFFGLFACAMLLLNSCTKTGPVGPQGVAGANGNANVIGQDPFTVSTWTYNSNTYFASFTDNTITADVANYGVVEIYKQYSDGTWTNLPDVNGDIATTYNFSTGSFYITIASTDGTVTPAPGIINFRTVIIPSSVRLANPHTNWKNYNEAISALNAANSAAAY